MGGPQNDAAIIPHLKIEMGGTRLMVNFGPETISRVIGTETESVAARALPLVAQDPSRMPDHIFGGPDLPADESVRRRFFGED